MLKKTICLGLISDTHAPQRCTVLPSVIFDVLQGVDLLLHAGDVGALWVLDQLSQLAPVVAVHGNDDTAESQQNLPFQQVLTIGGQRILLWHSHYPDQATEMASRQGDEIRPKLQRSLHQAKQAGATIVVFGHWHIPLVDEQDGILIINPGAIASGNFITRQTRQTVARLFIRPGGHKPVVEHIDLAVPNKVYPAWMDWDAGFLAAMARYSKSILSPELTAVWPQLYQEIYPLIPTPFLAALGRAGHRCWSGQQNVLAPSDLQQALLQEIVEPEIKTRLVQLLGC